MYRPIELFIGLRYTRAKRRNHFISFISLISMLGISLGVTALITVISVMNGFEKELHERILGVVSHMTVSRPGGELADWRGLTEEIKTHPRVIGVAPYINGEGMFSSGRRVSGTLVRGIDPQYEPQVSRLHEHMLEGTLDDLKPGTFGIIMGKALADSLSVTTGDKVMLIIPQASVTPAGILPRLKRFTVVGVFEAGMYEYDSALALMHRRDAARLYRLSSIDNVSGLRLKLDDLFAARKVRFELENQLGPEYYIRDWSQQHVNFFRAVRTEKTVMFVILTLIIAVAAFNIVSTLVMLVTDKQSDIAILRTLGATPRSIMGVFMVQGSLIGMVGTFAGVALGVLLAANVESLVPAIEKAFHVDFLPEDVYYISDLPSDLRMADIVKITLVSLLVSLLATIYPAWRASRTQPAEALRYE